jgi:hypothetical protein
MPTAKELQIERDKVLVRLEEKIDAIIEYLGIKEEEEVSEEK